MCAYAGPSSSVQVLRGALAEAGCPVCWGFFLWGAGSRNSRCGSLMMRRCGVPGGVASAGGAMRGDPGDCWRGRGESGEGRAVCASLDRSARPGWFQIAALGRNIATAENGL